jgi:anthraniloyl-CoA monooxygenase
MQFAFNIMTRSRRVTYDNLRVRDPEFVARCEAWYADHETPSVEPVETTVDRHRTPPMFQPVTLRAAEGPGLTLNNRVIVSPMDMYVAEDGVPTEFHLVHLGGKALGGASLVMTEMICPSAVGRISPGAAACGRRAARRLEARSTSAREHLGCHGRQLKLGAKAHEAMEGIDEPLPGHQTSWPPAVPYSPRNQTPGADRADSTIRDEFVAPPGARPRRTSCSVLRARLPAVGAPPAPTAARTSTAATSPDARASRSRCGSDA